MDNLPNDPPDQNNNPTPPSFGAGFDPHSNPVDPNNPYSSQPPNPPQPQIIEKEVIKEVPVEVITKVLD